MLNLAIPLSFLFLSVPALAHSGGAPLPQETCEENSTLFTGTSYSEIQELLTSRSSKVRFTIRGNPKVWSVRLLSQEGDEVRDGQNDLIKFIELDHLPKRTIQQVARGNITWIGPSSAGLFETVWKVYLGPIVLPAFIAHNAFQAAISPLRHIKKIGNIEVVGARRTDFERAIQMGNHLSKFDKFLEKAGFRLPSKTMLFVGRSTLLPNLYGSGGWLLPVYNIWRRQFLPNIVSLNPQFYNTDYLWDTSVLYRVRAEQIIAKGLNMGEAMFVALPTLKIGFASFLAAVYQKSPFIRFERNQVVDISKGTFLLDSGTNFGAGNSSQSLARHSLLVANTLWGLSEKLGPDYMLSHFQRMVDNMNILFKDYKSIKKVSEYPDFNKVSPQKYIYSFEYFLAALLHLSADWKEKEQIRQVVNEVAQEFGFTKKQIHAVSLSLDDDHRNSYKRRRKFSDSEYAAGIVGPIIGGVVDVGSILWIISTLF